MEISFTAVVDMCFALHFEQKLFKAVVPWYRIFYAGWVTTDGEHPNERYGHSNTHGCANSLFIFILQL